MSNLSSSHNSTSDETLDLKLEDRSWDIEVQMFEQLVDLLTKRSAVSPDKAASRVDELFPTHRSPNDGEKKEEPVSFLMEFWQLVFNIAQQIPPTHQAIGTLTDFVASLKRLDRETLKIWGRDTRLWTDLPLFGPQLTETREGLQQAAWEKSGLRALAAKLNDNGTIEHWVE